MKPGRRTLLESRKGDIAVNYDLTQGSIMGKLVRFSIPLMIGNMLQQLYNIVDTMVVSHYLGEDALAAVGSTYTLMIFLTSILLGLCMGGGVFFSVQFGRKDYERLKHGLFLSFVLIGAITLVLNIILDLVCVFAKPLMELFVGEESIETVSIGVGYLRIEASFYFAIGILFLFYGFYRAVKRPGMSVVLTVASLGTRVALAYILSSIPAVGVLGIWAAVPTGWLLADIIGGIVLYRMCRSRDCI